VGVTPWPPACGYCPGMILIFDLAFTNRLKKDGPLAILNKFTASPQAIHKLSLEIALIVFDSRE
jgi:hypothetical protein